jgi:hypothetical protein
MEDPTAIGTSQRSLQFSTESALVVSRLTHASEEQCMTNTHLNSHEHRKIKPNRHITVTSIRFAAACWIVLVAARPL